MFGDAVPGFCRLDWVGMGDLLSVVWKKVFGRFVLV